MACIEIPAPTNGDSEMEEGEIVDEVDELSDISSEEEFLLRQRLQVLENYNNVLERKQAKRTSNGPNGPSIGKRSRNEEVILCDLSEISETELEENNINVSHHIFKKSKPVKPYKRKKQTKHETVLKKIKDCKKKTKQNKKKSTIKVHIKSSDESDEEYFNKRRRLANAVTLKRNRIDTTTLKDRINRMLFGPRKPSNIIEIKKCNSLGIHDRIIPNVTNVQDNNYDIEPTKCQSTTPNSDTLQLDSLKIKSEDVESDDNTKEKNILKEPEITLKESINLCTDNESSQDVVDSVVNEDSVVKEGKTKEVTISDKRSDGSSDEDLELLREYALKTKSSKTKTETSNEVTTITTENKLSVASEDEDSDTAELRLICLKSTILKKAIEMKQKQKLRKRLSQSQSSTLEDDLLLGDNLNIHSENNTDIESVDMDIGSDGEDKTKENSNAAKFDSKINDKPNKDENLSRQEDELDEDEDLLRAKLLTSLSKNLPNLVNLTLYTSSNEQLKDVAKDKAKNTPATVPEEKKFIIKLGESDSEGEHEATKNLTKMHMKLAEHYHDFQSKLDTLLKSTRMEFEKDTLPDVVQKPVLAKPAEKFVPKAMNHLPKSEQIEYKNLVKRMAELEKIKQARNSLSSQNKMSVKETLKPRNTSLNSLKSTDNMEEKIALSRKKIAEESAKVLKLKEEAKKLSQKYKIVATELKNISTAINLNKRQQRAVHINLQKIRLNHQLLLKGSTFNPSLLISSNRVPISNKIQKENNPTPEEPNPTNLLKSVKVSFVNDVNKKVSSVESRLSVQLDVVNNKKIIKLPKIPQNLRKVDIVSDADLKISSDKIESERNVCHPEVEKGGGLGNQSDENNVNATQTVDDSIQKTVDDYKSPLEALGNTTWAEDPNAFLCPYEVGGSCRDPDCKYLHPKVPILQ